MREFYEFLFFELLLLRFLFFVAVADLRFLDEQGIGRTSGGADDYCKQVETSNPFFFSSTSRFFAKKGLFSILWAGPLKNDHFSSIAETGTYWPI